MTPKQISQFADVIANAFRETVAGSGGQIKAIVLPVGQVGFTLPNPKTEPFDWNVFSLTLLRRHNLSALYNDTTDPPHVFICPPELVPNAIALTGEQVNEVIRNTESAERIAKDGYAQLVERLKSK